MSTRDASLPDVSLPDARPITPRDVPLAGADLPAWPVLAMLWGFPLMWLLGLTLVGPVILACVMAAYLVHRRGGLVMPGVLGYVAFVAWVAATVVMIDTGPRLVGFVFRFAILLVMVVVLLYVPSAPRVTRASLLSGLTFVWFFVIAGGYLGVLLPHGGFDTPFSLFLPADIGSNPYVHQLMSPRFAEIQHPYGAPHDFVRPAAPFPYTNSWGAAMLLLTPIVAARFMSTRSWLLRCAVIAAGFASLWPLLESSNRGALLCLALAGVYVAVRLVIRDRATPVFALLLFGVGVVAVLLAGGLRTAISTRQEYSKTTTGRLDLYQETFQRTLHSPLLGYGAPRPSLRYEVSVGTQGYVWGLMFSFGFVGLLLFAWFLVGTLLRTWRSADDVSLCLHSVLVVTTVMIFFYGLDIMQMLFVFLVAALLLRERYVGPDDDLMPGTGETIRPALVR